jgi:hypothetical protein
MGGSEEAAVWPDECSAANCDGTGIQEGAVEVDIDTLAKAKVYAIVDLDRAIYPGIVALEKEVVIFLC